MLNSSRPGVSMPLFISVLLAVLAPPLGLILGAIIILLNYFIINYLPEGGLIRI
jgi:hypothetical protein